MKRISLVILQVFIFVLMISGSVFAGMAYPGVISVTDADGDEIKVYNHGDEFFNYITDLNGNLLIRDESGAMRYVVEKNGAFVLGDRVAAKGSRFAPSMSSGISVNINKEIPDLEEKLTALRAECAADTDGGIRLSAVEEPAPFPDDDDYDYADDPLQGKISQLFTVNKPEMGDNCALLVLKVEFADVKCQFTDAQWHKRIFDDGVSDYYTKVSNGRFTYVPATETAGTANDGVITVTLPLNQPRYSKERVGQNADNDCEAGIYTGTDGKTKYGIYNSSSFYGYGLEAAEENIDFAQYDKNKDGYVSPTELAVLVVLSGYEVSYGGAENSYGKPAVWAHSWNLNDLLWFNKEEMAYGSYLAVTVDGKKLYKYTIIGENVDYDFDYDSDDNTVEPRQAQFGTATHELGHDMGLPDLYDTSYGGLKYNVGLLSLMASGSWGQSDLITGEAGDCPSFLDPFSKLYLGFTEETVISTRGDYDCFEAATPEQYNILRLNTADPDIYYLIENRTAKSYDRALKTPYGTDGGVVIWRVDRQAVNDNFDSNRINCDPEALGVMPVFNEDEENTYPFRNDKFAAQFGDAVTLQSSPLLRVVAKAPVSASAKITLETSSNQAFMTAFSLNGVDGVIDNAAQTVTVTLPHGSDVTAAVAQFTVSDNATVAVGAVPQISGETANNFDKKTVVYHVTAENTTTIKDWTVTVKLLEATPAESIYFLGGSDTGGTLVGVDSTLRYSVDGGTTWQNFTDITEGKATIDGVTAQRDINHYRKANGAFSAASKQRTIDIQKPAAPQLTANPATEPKGKGFLPLTAAMEYKFITAAAWLSGTDGGVAVDPGRYQVRYADGRNTLRSSIQYVDVKTLHKDFVDVKKGDWFFQYVTPVCDLGLMSGVGHQSFDPSGATDRAMVAQILWNLEGCPDQGTDSGFGDVPQNAWYAKAVTWAKKNSIVNGYDEFTFGSTDPVTRAQLTALFYRYAHGKGLDVSIGSTTLNQFRDAADVPDFAQKSMPWAAHRGIVTGTEPTLLEPNAYAERSQIATVLYRFINVYYK